MGIYKGYDSDPSTIEAIQFKFKFKEKQQENPSYTHIHDVTAYNLKILERFSWFWLLLTPHGVMFDLRPGPKLETW